MPDRAVPSAEPQRESSKAPSRGLLAAFGAVVAAFGAALCCLGPILFVTLGVGAGLASTFEPLRPLFTVLAALGLGFGFYAVYGRPEVACAPGEQCEVPRSRRRDKILLWSATVLAVLLWSFNYWSLLLI